jgi:hypothetical protein
MDDYGLTVETIMKRVRVIEGPIFPSKPSRKVTPGCQHGGHPDCVADLCDACYTAHLRLLDRFGLWAPVQHLR